MKITAIINSLQGGGAERTLSLLSAEWARIGHRVDVLTFRHSERSSNSPDTLKLHPPLTSIGAKPQSWITKLFLIPSLLLRIRKEVRRIKPDVVICFMDQANILTLIATAGMRIPIVVSERTYPAYSSLFTMTNSWVIRSIFALLRNRSYRRAARIVLQSDRSISLFPAPLHKRIQVLPNPIVPPSSSGMEIEIPRPTILGLGRLHQQKRFDLLIDAFHRINQAFPDWHLLIAGSGPEDTTLQAQADRGPGAARIHFLGYQGNTASLFSQSSLFVLCSDAEGFPVALGEALISGVPGIATDCLTGPREILGDSRYGMLIPPGDSAALAEALGRAISDEGLRQQYAERGKIRAAEFSLQQIAPLWIAMLEEIPKNTGNL